MVGCLVAAGLWIVGAHPFGSDFAFYCFAVMVVVPFLIGDMVKLLCLPFLAVFRRWAGDRDDLEDDTSLRGHFAGFWLGCLSATLTVPIYGFVA